MVYDLNTNHTSSSPFFELFYWTALLICMALVAEVKVHRVDKFRSFGPEFVNPVTQSFLSHCNLLNLLYLIDMPVRHEFRSTLCQRQSHYAQSLQRAIQSNEKEEMSGDKRGFLMIEEAPNLCNEQAIIVLFSPS